MSVFSNPASRSAEHAKAYTAALRELLGSRDPMEVIRETPLALRRAVAGLSEQQMATPEAAGKWSIRHVLQHLADSELVWGYRLRIVIAQDRPPLTGYDQDLWADRLDYAHADPAIALDDFTTLRRGNIRLLERASADDLKRVGVHAERGEENIEHMLILDAGHDLLHLRQIQRIRGSVAAAEARS